MKLVIDALLPLLGGQEDGSSKQRLDTQDSVLSLADGSGGASFRARAAALLSHCGERHICKGKGMGWEAHTRGCLTTGLTNASPQVGRSLCCCLVFAWQQPN